MAIFRFTGRVLPASTNFTMDGPFNAHWEDSGIDPLVKFVMDASLRITKGVVEVHCESNLFGNQNYDAHVHLRAMDVTRTFVDSYAYARALGLSVILETVVKPDGIKYNIEEKRPDLADLVTAFGPVSSHGHGGINAAGMMPIIFNDLMIRVALNDLVSSLTQPEYATINCGRAIEAIRVSMTPGSGDRKQGWPAMRDNLNLHQDYLTFITDQSKGPRHGDMRGIAFADIRETVRRSWIVMNRFLEYKKRGDKQLPLTDFPLLKN